MKFVIVCSLLLTWLAVASQTALAQTNSTGNSTTPATNVTSPCDTAISNLANLNETTTYNCIVQPILGLVDVFIGTPGLSIVQVLDQVCTQYLTNCSGPDIAAAAATVQSACASDLFNATNDNFWVYFSLVAFNPLQKLYCTMDSTAPTANYCLVDTFTNFAPFFTALGVDIPTDLNLLPTNITCTSCNENIATTIFSFVNSNQNLFNPQVLTYFNNASTAFSTKCGLTPTSIQTGTSTSTGTSTAKPSSDASIFHPTVLSALVVVGLGSALFAWL